MCHIPFHVKKYGCALGISFSLATPGFRKIISEHFPDIKKLD